MDAPATRLCSKCRVLEINDATAGGRQAVAEDGEKYLIMARLDDETGGWHLPLEYDLTDSMPLLPKLETSAKEGCEFCECLRDTILYDLNEFNQKLVFSPRVRELRIRFCYVWRANRKDSASPGFLSLEAYLRPENLDDDWVATLVFRVEAIRGIVTSPVFT